MNRARLAIIFLALFSGLGLYATLKLLWRELLLENYLQPRPETALRQSHSVKPAASQRWVGIAQGLLARMSQVARRWSCRSTQLLLRSQPTTLSHLFHPPASPTTSHPRSVTRSILSRECRSQFSPEIVWSSILLPSAATRWQVGPSRASFTSNRGVNMARGQSADKLRALRRKYGLGEFAKGRKPSRPRRVAKRATVKAVRFREPEDWPM